jgi:D-3-phosphoglycerate dehydrogenase
MPSAGSDSGDRALEENAVNNRKRLLVAKAITAAGWALLKERQDIEAIAYDSALPDPEYHALLPGAHGIVLYSKQFGPAELAIADEMEVIGRVGVGYDLVDVPGCTAHGVLLTIAGTANSVSVAESALTMMLDLARRPAEFDAMMRVGDWSPRRLERPPSDLYQHTVLVVGFGRIGTRISARCRALEMTVLVCDPYVDQARIVAAGCEAVPLDQGLKRADFVTVHCPKNAETTGMIGAAQLASLRRGAYVVNTARGGIIEEAALYDALKSEHLAGAGLDVFVEEPTPTSHPLLTLPNVIVAPHMAGNTSQALDRMSVAAISNCLSVFDGKPVVENVVNKEALKPA